MATATRNTASPHLKTHLKLRMSQLVALNFQIDPKILKPYVPPKLEVDFFRDNETYVSLVAMKMSRIKMYGVPIPVTGTFGDLNLRFYVQRKTETGIKTGICTIKNYVSSRMGAWVLGSMFDSKFDFIKMKYSNTGFGNEQIPKVDYTWQAGERKNRIRIQARERVTKVGDDTKVGFILNHFNIFAEREGKTLEFAAYHPPWTIWDAAKANFSCDVKKLFGQEFVKTLSRRPASVFVSVGSGVTIYRPSEVT